MSRIWEIEREKGRPLTSVEWGMMCDQLRQNQSSELDNSIDDREPDWPGSPDLLPSERLMGGAL